MEGSNEIRAARFCMVNHKYIPVIDSLRKVKTKRGISLSDLKIHSLPVSMNRLLKYSPSTYNCIQSKN